MIVVLLNVYLVLLFLLVQLQDRSVQPVLEGLAGHRAAAAADRAVHPDGLGRAAGQCAGGAQFGVDRAGRRRRGARGAGRAEPAAQGRRRAVPHRSDAVPGAGATRSTRSSSSRSCAWRRWTQLRARGTGRAFDVEQRQAEVDQLKAQLDGAQWNLDKTVVRAPADGYVTNLALRKGARVANLPLAPVMAFIDTSETIIGVEIPQIDARYIEPGQPVEVTFKFMPGTVYTGKVETVLQAIATGQVQVSGAGGDADGGPVGAVRRAREARRQPTSPTACRRARPAPPRSSPTASRPRMSSARCCCGRSRS